MSDKQKSFLISHIDSLGQGVSKIDGEILFIPKTLPGESGICVTKKKQKKVQFAVVDKLNKENDERIQADCPHFEECGGCHFLHTTYEVEIKTKSANLKRLFKKFITEESWETIPAKSRHSYRNRIQVHYDINQNKIGFFKPFENAITNCENCLLPKKEIQQRLKDLVLDNSWKDFVKDSNKGHLELLLDEKNNVSISNNLPYSSGGFSQVNTEMNDILVNRINDIYINLNLNANDLCLDLFGGDGNLTKFFNHKTFVTDSFSKSVAKDHQTFINFDMYKNSVHDFMSHVHGNVGLMIIDPPRSGLKNLDEWVNTIKPKYLLYVSCNPATQKRDIENLVYKNSQEIKFLQSFAIDLFPSTFHLESVVLLELTFNNVIT